MSTISGATMHMLAGDSNIAEQAGVMLHLKEEGPGKGDGVEQDLLKASQVMRSGQAGNVYSLTARMTFGGGTMGACGRNIAGRTAGKGWDILLIDDTARFDNGRRVGIEECEGATIITAGSEEMAIAVLSAVAVDLIYNFPKTGKREDVERFRAHVSERYPMIRLMDPWTPSTRKEGEKPSHVLPLFMQERLRLRCATADVAERNAAAGNTPLTPPSPQWGEAKGEGKGRNESKCVCKSAADRAEREDAAAMMYLVVRDSGQTGELQLKGALAARDAEELKLYLHQAMRYVNDLTVDCSAVTGIDAACLQLLCSAYRMSLQQFRRFTPKGHAREVFLQAAQAANYAHCVGCGLENDRGCIWGVC